jgi:hypothetical protein
MRRVHGLSIDLLSAWTSKSRRNAVDFVRRVDTQKKINCDYQMGSNAIFNRCDYTGKINVGLITPGDSSFYTVEAYKSKLH